MARRGREHRGRYRRGLTAEAEDTLATIKRRDRPAFQVIAKFIDDLEDNPWAGKALVGPWYPCRSEHVYKDRYRVVWIVSEEDRGFVVERVGLRYDSTGRSVYDEPPGEFSFEPPEPGQPNEDQANDPPISGL